MSAQTVTLQAPATREPGICRACGCFGNCTKCGCASACGRFCLTAQKAAAADDLIASLPLPCPDCGGYLTSLGSDADERPLIQCGACGGIFDAIIFAVFQAGGAS